MNRESVQEVLDTKRSRLASFLAAEDGQPIGVMPRDGINPPETTTASTPAGTNPTVDFPDITKDFLKEEHKQRRQEITENLTRMEGDHRNGLILTGAIWSWLATNQSALAGQGQFEKFVVFMPAVLMAFFFYRWYAMHKSTHVNAAYLRELEAKAGVTPLGWETWLQDKRLNDPLAASLSRASRTFWGGLIAANLLLAVLFGVSRGWFGV
jgi:hypothetical protein